MVMRVNTDEIDLVLDTIGDPGAGGSEDSSPSGDSAADGAPPPRPPPRPKGAYKGRKAFEHLFDLSALKKPMPRGGPDEKLEFMRGKLKLAEDTIGTFQEAWATRNRELDALEALVASEQQRADSAAEDTARQSAKLTKLKEYFEQKKNEFEQYGQGVAVAFAEQEIANNALTGEIDSLNERKSALLEEIEAVKQDAVNDQTNLKHTQEEKLRSREFELRGQMKTQRVKLEERLATTTSRVKAERDDFEAELRGDAAVSESLLQDEIDELKQRLIAVEKASAEQALAAPPGGVVFTQDDHHRLGRAVDYVTRVIQALERGAVAPESRDEIMKRATKAARTACRLVHGK